MDGIYSGGSVAAELAGLIRSMNDGLCSDEPQGTRYAGVPSVDEVMERLGLTDYQATISEADYSRAAELIEAP